MHLSNGYGPRTTNCYMGRLRLLLICYMLETSQFHTWGRKKKKKKKIQSVEEAIEGRETTESCKSLKSLSSLIASSDSATCCMRYAYVSALALPPASFISSNNCNNASYCPSSAYFRSKMSHVPCHQQRIKMDVVNKQTIENSPLSQSKQPPAIVITPITNKQDTYVLWNCQAPVPILLGKVRLVSCQGELGDTPNIMGQGKTIP